MTDLALDFATLDGQLAALAPVSAPADPWLQRRALSWGASEMAAVLVVTGRRTIDTIPAWQAKRLAIVRGLGVPRIYAEKAGLKRPLAAGPAAKLGNERERELLSSWSRLLANGEYAIEEELSLDVESIAHASSAPREWMPLVSRATPRIAATPDAWCRDIEGRLYDVEIKCAAWEVHECKWTWQVQVQAQGMATSSEGAIVVAGEKWAKAGDHRGPIKRAFVAPDVALRRELAEAAEEAWDAVEKLRSSI